MRGQVIPCIQPESSQLGYQRQGSTGMLVKQFLKISVSQCLLGYHGVHEVIDRIGASSKLIIV